ncbi:MAG: 3-methyl-2-oxobutanoate hydroxymethyltransferase [Deltaproteobacteria bacterium]|nr:3-methyl-2-oxobutanoate hydroxymethyltransferase [Deltaproteobacteria bacterium]
MKHGRLDIGAIQAKKQRGEKITMLTAYDFPTARLLDEAGIDSILVGDSAGNVVLGYRDTIPVTMDEMVLLTKAVTRAVKRAFVIGDMPFMSFNVSVEKAIENAGRFVKEGGAQAVKIEGGTHVEDTVRAIVRAGIPVVGHIGLTPQTAGMLGGYRVQGRTAAAARRIVNDAVLLEQAGAGMIVVECVPAELAGLLSSRVKVPVIGIGSGAQCDGQVLVVNDMLGIAGEIAPKFVKRYAELGAAIATASAEFRDEVSRGTFPGPEHAVKMEPSEYRKLVGRARARSKRR